MQKVIQKRDGSIVPFHKEKIAWAIFKAATAVGGDDWDKAESLADTVVSKLGEKSTVENVQDIVEKVLIESGHAKTAKACNAPH